MNWVDPYFPPQVTAEPEPVKKKRKNRPNQKRRQIYRKKVERLYEDSLDALALVMSKKKPDMDKEKSRFESLLEPDNGGDKWPATVALGSND